MRQFFWLVSFLSVCALGDVIVVGPLLDNPQPGDPAVLEIPPTAIDTSFDFGETNINDIRDLELFPDGRIAYGGLTKSYSTVGLALSDGRIVNPNSGGQFLTVAESIALDPHDGSIYGAGTPRSTNDAPVTRVANWDDFYWAFNTDLHGTASTIIRLPNRDLVVAGRLEMEGDTNQFFGLAKIGLSGRIDPTFNYSNFIGSNVNVAAVTHDGKILAGYVFGGDEQFPFYGIGRWFPDGSRDHDYERFNLWATSFGTNSHATVIAKAPGTNGFVAAVQTEPVGADGPKVSKLMFLDEDGIPKPVLKQPEWIEGAVHGIAFEAVHPDTVASGGYDRIIVAGDFTRVGDIPARNLAAITTEGVVVWAFSMANGPSGPIHAAETQLDGKILIGGSFTNFGGVAAAGMARLVGSSGSGATYVFWADGEFRGFEKEGAGELILRRGGKTDDALTLNLTVTWEAGGTLNDLGLTPPTVTFPANSEEISVPVTILDDTLRENRERFVFRVSVANTNVLLTRAATELVVLDNETPGTLDPTFDSAAPWSGTFAVQRDGKILVAQPFASLWRLFSDGSRDESFVTNGLPVPTGDWRITQILPQADGKIYVAGKFTTLPHSTYGINHVARLNADGTLDRTFDPRLQTASSGFTDGARIALMNDGDVLVWAGNFIRRESLFTETLFRLDQSGEVDKGYWPVANFRDYALIEVLPNDDVLLYGDSSLLRGEIMKLLSDGRTDTNFVVNVPVTSGYVYDMEVIGDWLVLAGSFKEVNSTAVTNLARVDLTTGALDTNFNVRVNGEYIWAIEEHDGKIYLGGEFTEVNGRQRMRVARLNADWTIDSLFDPGLGPNRAPGTLVLQADGKMLMGSSFDRVDGLPTDWLVRLEGDAAPGVIRMVTRRIVVNETNSVVTIEVERIGGSAGPLSATIQTLEGSAQAGTNFVPMNVTVTFADGEIGIKSIEIPILRMVGRTGDRTFAVRLQSGMFVDEGTVLIEDDFSAYVESTARTDRNSTNSVRDLEVGADGAIYVAGDFAAINAMPVTNLARLNLDLNVDVSFALEALPKPLESAGDPANELYAPIEAIAVRTNGDIAFSGNFVEIGGSNWTFLAQVDSEGRYDAEFIRSNVVTFGVTTIASNLVLQPDGKLLTVLGPNGLLRRLNPDGTRDARFANMVSGAMRAVVHPDGSIYVLRQNLSVTKLGTNGQTISTFFATGRHISQSGFSEGANIEAITFLPDGNMLLGGDFTHVNNVFTPRLARVDTNGVVDTNFNAAVGLTLQRKNETVSAIQVLPSGDILIGGTFSEVQGVPQRGLALLDSNGVLRAEFDPVVEGGRIEEFALLADGTVLAHGDVTTLDGVEVGEVIKLRIPTLLPPVVEILWPTNETEIHTSDVFVPFEIQVRAFDPDGFLQDVVLSLDDEPISTNSAGNFTFETIPPPPGGDHVLTATATDENGLRSTHSVSLRVVNHPFPPDGGIQVRNEGGQIIISYLFGRLQASPDLRTWRDVHNDGGEYTPASAAEHEFFRVMF